MLEICHSYMQERMRHREELHWRFHVENEVIRYLSVKFPEQHTFQTEIASASSLIHLMETSILGYSRLNSLEEQVQVLRWFAYSNSPPSVRISPALKVTTVDVHHMHLPLTRNLVTVRHGQAL